MKTLLPENGNKTLEFKQVSKKKGKTKQEREYTKIFHIFTGFIGRKASPIKTQKCLNQISLIQIDSSASSSVKLDN
jgi:hypothetical protein